MTSRTPATRDFVLRENDGIRAVLLWHPHEDA